MKRTLQRIWYWPLCSCLLAVGVITFYLGEKWKAEAFAAGLWTGPTNGITWATNYFVGNSTNVEVVRHTTTVEWVGKIVIGNMSDPYNPHTSWLPYYELGLRSDGMVVWRERK